VEILHHQMMQLILETMIDSIPMISFWPNGSSFCLVLTHDVETSTGYDNVNLLVDIERKYGFRSAWNFVPKRYPIEMNLINKLQEDGFEVGVHGLYHDGKLFQSYEKFLKRAQQINAYLKEWNSVGFRSPSVIRKIEWISNHINADYDTSCPTTEYFGAQPGGCCSVFPFTYNGIVELPLTLPEDHTLLEILCYSPEQMLENWLQVVQTIKHWNGLVLLNVHPDYLTTSQRLQSYERFLQIMSQEPNCWHALPKEVAQWWHDRNISELVEQGNSFTIKGPIANNGRIMEITLQQDQLNIRPIS